MSFVRQLRDQSFGVQGTAQSFQLAAGYWKLALVGSVTDIAWVTMDANNSNPGAKAFTFRGLLISLFKHETVWIADPAEVFTTTSGDSILVVERIGLNPDVLPVALDPATLRALAGNTQKRG